MAPDRQLTAAEDARLGLRPMRPTDLELVAARLDEPHVARWWTADTTTDALLAVSRLAGTVDHQGEAREEVR